MKPTPEVNQLWEKAVEARTQSYSPYSKFAVGAAFLSSQGKVFTGCNVENASYGGTVCAERTAILKAVSEGHRQFKRMVVVGELTDGTPPCAICLQVMAEFCDSNFELWLGTPKGIIRSYRFDELLPLRFGPSELQNRPGAKP